MNMKLLENEKSFGTGGGIFRKRQGWKRGQR